MGHTVGLFWNIPIHRDNAEFILFIKRKPSSGTAASARSNVKKRNKKERQVRREKKKEGDQGREGQTYYPNPDSDALIGDEE